MVTLKDKYAILKKKYSLPEYDVLNLEFEIENISAETDLVLVNVRQKMTEKVEYYAKMIESRLQPESSLGDLYEAHNISENEKNDAYAVFKKLMYAIRSSTLVAIANKEEDNAKFIKETYEMWNSVKKDLHEHISKLLSLWKKETDIMEDLSYLG